jgi:cell division protein FtsL
MKERVEKGNMKGKKILITVLISIIIILALVIGYGVYSGAKIKAEITSLTNQVTQLNEEKNNLVLERNNLVSDFDILKKKYDLLYDDVQKIYKTCPTENACKGRFPGVSWYCNNVGDEIDIGKDINSASHICVCDVSCNFKATQITS